MCQKMTELYKSVESLILNESLILMRLTVVLRKSWWKFIYWVISLFEFMLF